MSEPQTNGIPVQVTEIETNISTTYKAIKAAARVLGIDKKYIDNYIFFFTKLNLFLVNMLLNYWALMNQIFKV